MVWGCPMPLEYERERRLEIMAQAIMQARGVRGRLELHEAELAALAALDALEIEGALPSSEGAGEDAELQAADLLLRPGDKSEAGWLLAREQASRLAAAGLLRAEGEG